MSFAPAWVFVKWHSKEVESENLYLTNVLRRIFDGSFRKHHMGLTIYHLFLIKGPNLLSLEKQSVFFILKAQM